LTRGGEFKRCRWNPARALLQQGFRLCMATLTIMWRSHDRSRDRFSAPRLRQCIPKIRGVRGTPRTCRSSRSRLKNKNRRELSPRVPVHPGIPRAVFLGLLRAFPGGVTSYPPLTGQRRRNAILPSRDAPSREAQWRTACAPEIRGLDRRIARASRIPATAASLRLQERLRKTPLSPSEVDRNIIIILILSMAESPVYSFGA
jgi:hypothetical protein